ncbi:MAG: DUF1292 domain-containing protein [Bacilli bacterium]|nr:DUF1292 domain-containing protein [Bacilli bacterium]
MDRKVTITNSQGQKAVADIVKIFRINELNSDYIVYTFNQKDASNNVKDYVSKLRVENGNYYFDTISDDKEWEQVKNVLTKLCKGGE